MRWVFFSLLSAAAASSLPTHPLASLLSDPSILLASLLAHGGVAVSEIPGYSASRKRLLNLDLSLGLASSNSFTVKDSTTQLSRTTLTSPVHSGALDLSPSSPLSPLNLLRTTIDLTVTALLTSLSSPSLEGKIPLPPSLAGVAYENGTVEPLAAVAVKGEGIEHYHRYTGSPVSSQVMASHEDAGVLVAMTVGGSPSMAGSSVGGSSGSDLDIDPFLLSFGSADDPSTVDPDSLIIMLGAGAAAYLSGSLSLRSLPHSLSIPNLPVSAASAFPARSWYGRMYFPPADSVVPGASEGGTSEVFAAVYRRLTADTASPSNGILGSSDCGENSVYCWKQCVSAASLPCSSSAAVCFDTGSNEVVPFPKSRDEMCESGMKGCELVCPLSQYVDGEGAVFSAAGNVTGEYHPIRDDSDDFCRGTGTDMFMDGFQFVLFGDGGASASLCLNLLLPSLTLDSPVKFWSGLLFQFALAVFVEFLSSVRRKTFKGYSQSPTRRRYYKIVLTLQHMLQAALGYFVMLAAMSYSFEMFTAIVLGLGLGHFAFNVNQPPQGKAEPCCAEDQFNYSEIGEGGGARSRRSENKPLVDGVTVLTDGSSI